MSELKKLNSIDVLYKPNSAFNSSRSIAIRYFSKATNLGTDHVSTKNNDRSRFNRIKLEKDVEELQEQLRQERELHHLLERAAIKSEIESSCSSYIPYHVQELLSNITALKTRVSNLEQEIVSLNFRLVQERNERRLSEYRLRHSSSPLKSADSVELFAKNRTYCDKNHILSKGLQTSIDANELSKEMIRCMRNIFVSVGESSSTRLFKSSAIEKAYFPAHRDRPSSPSGKISRWMLSPRIHLQNSSDVLAMENTAFDPYRVHGKLSWTQLGNYRLATEVSWMSVEKNRLEYASQELWKFRTLVERLATVNPRNLNNDEKLAFWINIYNTLIMHAYLAYGVPKSDLKLFSLMQKAAYTIGGCSYGAATIEYVILKMNPPLYRPQIALLLSIVKLKVSDEQREAAIAEHEPLVSFALSCGMYSSPAVRVYTAENVRDELEEAQRDYIQASVGISTRGKLVVPKMVYVFAKNIISLDSKIGLWISRHLPPPQAALVEQCIAQRRPWSFLGSSSSLSRNCIVVVPFDSRFRYLFLP